MRYVMVEHAGRERPGVLEGDVVITRADKIGELRNRVARVNERSEFTIKHSELRSCAPGAKRGRT